MFISLQCVPAGTLPLMSPTTPQSQCFLAPQEFEDPLQMVEWLILLESKLQPEKLIVGDFLHIRKALRDVQVSSVHVHLCLLVELTAYSVS